MIYDEKFRRNPLTKKQQKKIRDSLFAIVGLGGTGGFVLENLLRMGAENFIVFDHDRFELSNFNRQTLATEEFLDVPKVHAALSRGKAINPDTNIKVFHKFSPDSDISGASILIDGADNLETKIAMAALANKEKIPYVFCSAEGTRGMVTVFKGYPFGKAFQLPKDPEALDRYNTCSSILCPAASLSASIASSMAVNLLLKKPYVRAPEAIFFDLFREDPFWRGRLG